MCKYYSNDDEAVHMETSCILWPQARMQRGEGLQSSSPPTKSKKKVFIFCTDGDMKLLRDLAYSRNQPLKSADD